MPGVAPPPEPWTRGEEYVQKVKKGVRPVYSPDLTGGLSREALPVPEQVEDSAAVVAETAEVVAEPAIQRQTA